MNPGKLIDAVRVYDPVENLRHGVELHGGESNAALETHFAFAADEGSFERATERCVGVGACRNTEGGVMCPSYRATGEEQHSTRGRARLLWEMLAGALRQEGFQSEAVHEALDLCLSCKACKSECPVQVDMAAWKSEFLAQHYKGRLHPLQHYIFGFADQLARWGSLAPALTNAILTGPLTSPLIKRIAGVAQERATAATGAEELSKKREHRVEHATVSAQSSSMPGPPVVLWPDTWNNYYHPQTLSAAETVLAQAGFQVEVPRGHICCGRPLYDFGLARRRPLLSAPQFLTAWRRRLTPAFPSSFLSRAAPASSKTSCSSYSQTIARAKRLSGQVWLLADWLARRRARTLQRAGLHGAHILVHGHCHHKAVFGGPASEIALLRKAGATVEPIQAGCCGMAGPSALRPTSSKSPRPSPTRDCCPPFESAGSMTIIVADGFSCREQIASSQHRKAMHFAEVLARHCGCGG